MRQGVLCDTGTGAVDRRLSSEQVDERLAVVVLDLQSFLGKNREPRLVTPGRRRTSPSSTSEGRLVMRHHDRRYTGAGAA